MLELRSDSPGRNLGSGHSVVFLDKTFTVPLSTQVYKRLLKRVAVSPLDRDTLKDSLTLLSCFIAI